MLADQGMQPDVVISDWPDKTLLEYLERFRLSPHLAHRVWVISAHKSDSAGMMGAQPVWHPYVAGTLRECVPPSHGFVLSEYLLFLQARYGPHPHALASHLAGTLCATDACTVCHKSTPATITPCFVIRCSEGACFQRATEWRYISAARITPCTRRLLAAPSVGHALSQPRLSRLTPVSHVATHRSASATRTIAVQLRRT